MNEIGLKPAGRGIGRRVGAVVFAAGVLFPLLSGAAESAPLRVETRAGVDGLIVTGTETIGSADGASHYAWDTTQVADGAFTLPGSSVRVTVLKTVVRESKPTFAKVIAPVVPGFL